MYYYAIIREGRKIIKKEITTIKSNALDILIKDLEKFAKNNGNTKGLLKMAKNQLKTNNKTDLLGPIFEIVSKNDDPLVYKYV